jgi:hypothetical protein
MVCSVKGHFLVYVYYVLLIGHRGEVDCSIWVLLMCC